ncbi:MAG: phenylalanine--tRNA ligase subunit alpha, partial [Rhodothermales bacterium]
MIEDRVHQLKEDIGSEPLRSEEEIEAFRVRYLGRKSGLITDLFKQMSAVPPAERRT